MTDSTYQSHDRADTRNVATSGSRPPSEDRLDAVVASVLDDIEAADNVAVIRFSVAADRDEAFASALVDALADKLTVVSSSSHSPDGDQPWQLDVLVETTHDTDHLASKLSECTGVTGVLVADVVAETPPRPDDDGAELSIYRLDEHLVVTDDARSFLERLYAELDVEPSRAGQLDAESDQGEGVDAERLPDEQDTGADRIQALEDRLDAVDDRLEATASDLGAVQETATAARQATSELATRVEEVAASEPEGVADLRAHVEADLPTKDQIERIFAPASDRIDGEGTHESLVSCVAEIDRELRRTHALREAGLIARLRWLVTGRLPADDGGRSAE